MRGIGAWVAVAGVAVAAIVGGVYFFSSPGGSGDRERFKAMVDQAFAQMPPGYAPAYKAIDYAAGKGTVSGITVHKPAPDAADLSIDEVEFTRPNLDFAAAWSKAAGDAKALTQETVIPAFEGAVMKRVRLRSDTASFSVGSMSFEGTRFYPWSLFQPGVPRWAEVQDLILLKNRAPAADLQAIAPLLRFVAAVGMLWSIDGYAVETLQATAKMPPVPPNPAMDVSYDVRKMTSRALDRGMIAEAAIEGLSMEMGPMGKTTLERIGIVGYDLRKPMSQLLAAATPKPEMLDGLKIGKVEYSGISIQYPDQRPPIALARMAISNVAFTGFVPVSGGFALDGLRLNKQMIPEAQAREGFDKLGLDTLTVGVGATYQWDLAQKHLALRDIVVKVDELGALNLAVDVTDIVPNMLGAMQAQLAHALLKYDDASLVDRAVKAAAELQRRDPAEVRTMLVELVNGQAAQFADSPKLAAAAKALVEFIGAPHSLTIELSPPQPVALMSLQGAAAMPPPELATTLGLSVTANH